MLKGGIPSKEIMVFTRQFAVMVKTGVPIVRCLEILAKQTQNKAFHTVILDITKDIETGNTLTAALLKHSKVFDQLYISMAKAGEVGGVVDTTLTRVTQHLEKSEALKGKIRSAITYPAVIFVVAVGPAFFLLTFIIPTYAQLFSGFGAELPALTPFVIALSNFVRQNFIYLFFGLIALAFGVRAYARKPQGKKRFDTLKLNMPVFGPLLRKTAVARFSRTLSPLTSPGVSVFSGLEVTTTTSGNKVIEEVVLKARESISGGRTIYQPPKESGLSRHS